MGYHLPQWEAAAACAGRGLGKGKGKRKGKREGLENPSTHVGSARVTHALKASVRSLRLEKETERKAERKQSL